MLPTKRFSLRIEADDALRWMLPCGWKDYLANTVSSDEEFTLKVMEDPSLLAVLCNTGWSAQIIDGCKTAVFAPKTKPYFTLTCDPNSREVVARLQAPFMSFVQISVLYGMLLALHQICVGLHGVTLQCGDQTIILSAPSGTGKTTLSKLLEEYCGARVLNGDFAMLAPSEKGAIFEPTPFCGTSGVCVNERAKVNRIVFLSQAKENIWKDLDGRNSFRNLMRNSFVPVFDRQMSLAVQQNILRIQSAVKISEFSFTPTKDAAELFLSKVMQNAHHKENT